MSEPEPDAKSETIQLAEYAEACQACRAYDQLTRTGLTIFVTFTTALLVATQSNVFNDPSKVGLAIVSMVMLNINFRLRDYYRSYMSTAKKIEKNLGMSLYTDAWKDVQNSWTLSNKIAIGFISWCQGCIFVVLPYSSPSL